MKRAVRPVLWTVAAFAAALGLTWVLRPPPVRVESAPVGRGTLTATVSAEGKVRVKNAFVVAAPVDGELERIALKAGDTVSTSTIVAQLRPLAPRPLDTRSRAEADAVVAAARAEVQRAEAAVQAAAAALTHAQSVLETSVRLAREGAVAPNDAEHAGHEVEIRRQAQRVTESALAQTRAALSRAEASASASIPDRNPATIPLRSPAAGRVLRVVRESSGPVRLGEPLLEIADVGTLEIVADFLTTDAVMIQPGATATVLDWGGAASLAARVRQVEPNAFTKVSALGLEEQRVGVILDLIEPPPVVLGNGFHVKVAAVVWTGNNVLTLPSTALFRNGDGWAAFVIRDGRARLTPVAVGNTDGLRTVIESGLREGDEVITQPIDSIVDGTRVAGTRPPRQSASQPPAGRRSEANH